MTTLRERFYPTATSAPIEIRQRGPFLFALSAPKYPHDVRSEDGKQILGKVLWNSSIEDSEILGRHYSASRLFWLIYGDGIYDIFEKVDGQWPLFSGKVDLIPPHIERIALCDADASEYFGAETRGEFDPAYEPR